MSSLATNRPESGVTTKRSIRPTTKASTFVAGALNSPRSPQAYPLLVQAGSSDDGKDFAARYAEAVFTAQQTLANAQAFYSDLKSRTHREGRDPNTIKILPGIVPVLGSTEKEAKEREAELEEHIVHEHAQQMLARLLRVPRRAARSRWTVARGPARRERDRGLQEPLLTDRGVGTQREVDDPPAHWSLGRRSGPLHVHRHARAGRQQDRRVVNNGAADGFNIMPPLLPSGPRALRRARGAHPAARVVSIATSTPDDAARSLWAVATGEPVRSPLSPRVSRYEFARHDATSRRTKFHDNLPLLGCWRGRFQHVVGPKWKGRS